MRSRLKTPNESVELVIVPGLDPADQAVGVEIAAGAAVGGTSGNGHARRQRRSSEIELGHGIDDAGMPSYIDTRPAHRRWIISDGWLSLVIPAVGGRDPRSRDEQERKNGCSR